MSLATRKPLRRVGVGGMYVCFKDNTATSGYEDEVLKTNTVVSIGTTENRETSNIWASNQIYDTDTSNEPPTLSVENIALDPPTLDRMRGARTEGAFAVDSDSDVADEFAYGIAYPKSSGHFEFVWYPNCKRISQSDDAQTKDDGGSNTQNPTTTIQAYPFNEQGQYRVRYDTSKVADGETPLTEEEFFAAVLTEPLPAA